MTISISISEKSCRGCELCADVCPTDVLVLEPTTRKMRVDFAQDCIGCLSCAYVCPSAALRHDDVPLVKNFSRNTVVTRNLSRYL
jgi:formate hydrogenlyase subunit 6/NADH:ubiquinone oxidoreductase subunit I